MTWFWGYFEPSRPFSFYSIVSTNTSRWKFDLKRPVPLYLPWRLLSSCPGTWKERKQNIQKMNDKTNIGGLPASRAVLQNISYMRTFRLIGYHSPGPMSPTGCIISHIFVLTGSSPQIFSFPAPSNHIISLISCAFVEMRENAKLCTVCIVLNTVMLSPFLNR